MKYLIITLFTFLTQSLFAQNKELLKSCELDSINGMSIHEVAETSPEYKGGLHKFYTDLASISKLKGVNEDGCVKVILSFVVDNNGNMSNVCFTENVNIPEESISTLNNWTPGEVNGVKVPVRMYIPMYIKLG